MHVLTPHDSQSRARIRRVAMATVGIVGLTANVSDASSTTHFEMARSAAAVGAGCLPDAKADVTVTQFKDNEGMTVRASGSPAEHRVRPVHHPAA